MSIGYDLSCIWNGLMIALYAAVATSYGLGSSKGALRLYPATTLFEPPHSISSATRSLFAQNTKWFKEDLKGAFDYNAGRSPSRTRRLPQSSMHHCCFRMPLRATTVQGYATPSGIEDRCAVYNRFTENTAVRFAPPDSRSFITLKMTLGSPGNIPPIAADMCHTRTEDLCSSPRGLPERHPHMMRTRPTGPASGSQRKGVYRRHSLMPAFTGTPTRRTARIDAPVEGYTRIPLALRTCLPGSSSSRT
ncbi:hypothetical protein NUW54_g10109 [Trametes sanguinea]|uniref:Uncharacterized protein n=1 Tax=Trametes sanguinea TaxID=158606 RepID=A0ACC1P285_9APHY|nr:hypothetical protein NUW54_g10109 [Trametes sanguinea]